MKIYDVLVIGNDISAYYAASLLGQKGYHVAHVLPDQPQIKEATLKTETSELEPTFFGRKGISELYLNQTHLSPFLQKELAHYKEVLSDGRLLTRNSQKEALRRYLLRHFPQARHDINRWFTDRNREYQQWAKAHQLFFTTDQRTFIGFLETYQTLSLKELLDQYFKSEDLQESIQMMMNFHGYSLKEMSAVEFILQWFWLIEEDAVQFNLDPQEVIKHFKKQSPDVEYLKSALKSLQFNRDHYEITLKNKDQLISRFIIGQTTRHDDDVVSYRHIDVTCEPRYFEQTFKEEIVFKKTPLFDSLRIIPLDKYHPKFKHHLRIETISDANKDLILTFVDRYFKGFEKNMMQSIEYPPIRKRLRDLEDKLSETLNPEVDFALWSQPKWIQIDLNHQPKALLAKRLFKTDSYIRSLTKALEKESHPSVFSPVYKAFEKWVFRFENPQPLQLSFKLGFQHVHLVNAEDGAVVSLPLNIEPLEIPTDSFVAMPEHEFSQEKIEQLPIEQASIKLLKNSLVRPTPPLNIPLGFIQLHLVMLFLISLTIFPFNATLTFAAAATIGLSMILRWLFFKEWAFFEVTFGIGLIIVSFLQLSQNINIGYLLIVFAGLSWILQTLPHGIFRQFFVHDPLRLNYSMLYVKKFSQRMTQYLSLALFILGIGAGFSSLLITIGTGGLALMISIYGYIKPLKPVVRKI